MSEKISTIILKVGLGCRMCYKKIHKILCKLQDEERIRTISYDVTSKSITIAGLFDPHKLSCRIRCMGLGVKVIIKAIQIMASGDMTATMAAVPPVNSARNKPKEKPKGTGPPPSTTQPHVLQKDVSAAKSPIVEEKKPKESPADLERPINFPWPATPVRLCGCPCCQGCRCCNCGRVYGYAVSVGPPAGAPCCGGYRGCQLFIEEDPASACSIT